MDLIMTLDVGTTSIKTCLFNTAFQLLAQVGREYDLITGAGGFFECDPESYWQNARAGITLVLQKASCPAGDVRVIAITTQGETLIPVDREGQPLRRAIIWMDNRASEEARFIGSLVSDRTFYNTTGLPEINGALPVSKILWIKKHEPDVYAHTFKFLLLEDYLIFKLTGLFITEKSLISSTGYFDINRDQLWLNLLTEIGIGSDRFPEIRECGTPVARIRPEVAADLDLPQSIIVATGAMDQVASAIGAGSIKPGIVTETTGTALVVATTLAEAVHQDNLYPITLYRHARPGLYLALSYCMTAGIILKWFMDEFYQSNNEQETPFSRTSYAVLDQEAAQIAPLANGLILYPYFCGKSTPVTEPARGVFFGIGLDSSRPHFARAILEGVAYMLRENIEALEHTGTPVREIRSLGGGANSNVWLQIKADVTGKELTCMEFGESTSVGAAILASLAVGMQDSLEGACALLQKAACFQPDQDRQRLYQNGYRKYKQLENCLKPMWRLW